MSKAYTCVLNAENRRTRVDGMFRPLENDRFVLTCVHGGMDGRLFVEWRNKKQEVTPSQLRGMFDKYAAGKHIVITPCFPAAVHKKYAAELEAANISLHSITNEQPTFVIFTNLGFDLYAIEVGVKVKGKGKPQLVVEL